MWTCGKSFGSALTLAMTVFALPPMVFPHLAAANPVEKAFGDLDERSEVHVKVDSSGQLTIQWKSGNNSQQHVVPSKQSPQEGATPSLGGDGADANESSGAGNAPADDDLAGGSEDQADVEAPEEIEETDTEEPEGDEDVENAGEEQA